MSYSPDHTPCSNCSDVNWNLDPSTKAMLVSECVEACSDGGGNPNPIFWWSFEGQTNCRPFKECYINNMYEQFKCNCKYCPIRR